MSKRSFVFVGIAAALLTGFSPVWDGCAAAASVDHACCAEPVREASTASCCSEMETAETRHETGHEDGCGCIHSPSVPADLPVSAAPPALDDSISGDLKTAERIFGGMSSTAARSNRALPRSHPPPPAFLLGCAFLT